MPNQIIIGVDVGGTKINSGLVSDKKNIVKRNKIPTEAGRGKETIIKNIEQSIAAVWEPGVKAIGVGLAGITDHAGGIFIQGPNFPKSFRNLPLGRLLQKKFGVPVAIDNDVHCFALAEAELGAAAGKRNVIGLTLGTGIGGGIVIDGRLYRGRNNAAGEVGHMLISGDTRSKCGCGQVGHFEALASGSAMVNLFAHETGKKTDTFYVEKEALQGNAVALGVLETMSDALAAGLANLIHMLNPDAIVIGGGLIRVKALWQPLQKKIRKLIVFPDLRDTPVLISRLGDDANVLGAAILART